MGAPAAARVAPQLEFEASTHTYRVDGVIVPGVTSVLKTAGIIDYSMIPQDVLRTAAARGTAVHLALQFLDEGTLDRDSISEDLVGYISAYERFCADSGFTCAQIEQRVYHPGCQYAGTLDRTGVIGGGLAVLDFKTGLVLPGHALQLAAYTYALPMPRRFRRLALKLNGDGTYRVHEFPPFEFQRDVDLFLSALACHQWNLQQQRRAQ